MLKTEFESKTFVKVKLEKTRVISSKHFWTT